MLFKVVGTFKSALSRQISEAVRIRGRGPLALNSKSEYDRCKIHRLTIGKEKYQKGGEQLLDGTILGGLNGTQGEHYLMERRRQMDRNNYESEENIRRENSYLLGNSGGTRRGTRTLD